MYRIYDPKIDNCYDPNSMPDVYLTERQTNDALEKIANKSAEYEAVKKLIETIETLRRKKCTGLLTQTDYSIQCRKLQTSFANKFGCWAYQTDAYEEFYSQFGDVAR